MLDFDPRECDSRDDERHATTLDRGGRGSTDRYAPERDCRLRDPFTRHVQPALEIVRSVIVERWRQRVVSHTLVDMNNHPDTKIEDLWTLLELSLVRARADARPRE